MSQVESYGSLGSYGSRVVLARDSSRINRGNSEERFVRSTSPPVIPVKNRINPLPTSPSPDTPTRHPKLHESKWVHKAERAQEASRHRVQHHRGVVESSRRELQLTQTSAQLKLQRATDLELEQAREQRDLIQAVLTVEYNSTPHALRTVPSSLFMNKADNVDPSSYDSVHQAPPPSLVRCDTRISRPQSGTPSATLLHGSLPAHPSPAPSTHPQPPHTTPSPPAHSLSPWSALRQKRDVERLHAVAASSEAELVEIRSAVPAANVLHRSRWEWVMGEAVGGTAVCTANREDPSGRILMAGS